MAIFIVLFVGISFSKFNEMWLSHLWLALGWIAYGAIHSLLASGRCKEFISVKFPLLFRYYLVFYILVAIFTMLPLVYMIWKMPRFPVLGSRYIFMGCRADHDDCRKHHHADKSSGLFQFDSFVPIPFYIKRQARIASAGTAKIYQASYLPGHFFPDLGILSDFTLMAPFW